MRIYSGQVLHLIGDGVSAGEILVSGEILKASTITAHNEFGKAPAVAPADFRDAKVNGKKLTLRMGDGGTLVADLQRALKELGYYAGNVSSDYAATTYNAVRRTRSSGRRHKPRGRRLRRPR